MTTVEPIRSLKDLRKIKSILSASPRDLLLFTLGINSGLRISDLLALNVGDVRDKEFIQLIEKKTKKFKKFPINKKLKLMFDSYIVDKSDDEPLFMSKFNNRLSRVTAYYVIRQTCEKLNPEVAFGTHTMRKTFGYHHYKKYRDVAILQKIFNHSSPSTTLRYIGIDEESIYKSYMDFCL